MSYMLVVIYVGYYKKYACNRVNRQTSKDDMISDSKWTKAAARVAPPRAPDLDPFFGTNP